MNNSLMLAIAAPKLTEDVTVAISSETASAELGSGIDLSAFDTSVRPQDDFFKYVNGKWVSKTEMPPDRDYYLKDDEQFIKGRLTTDPHSPPKFRANGAPLNVDAFYRAFDVKEGDGMYLPPEERVKIW